MVGLLKWHCGATGWLKYTTTVDECQWALERGLGLLREMSYALWRKYGLGECLVGGHTERVILYPLSQLVGLPQSSNRFIQLSEMPSDTSLVYSLPFNRATSSANSRSRRDRVCTTRQASEGSSWILRRKFFWSMVRTLAWPKARTVAIRT
jgi:hypothetical protein